MRQREKHERIMGDAISLSLSLFIYLFTSALLSRSDALLEVASG